jgi:hypothetical protein
LSEFESLREKWQAISPHSPERKRVEDEIMFYINKHKKYFLNYIKENKLSKGGH